MSLGTGGSAGRGKAGRSLSYGTKVQFKRQPDGGHKPYTAQLGLQTGDEFEIKLGRKLIQLMPFGGPRGSTAPSPAWQPPVPLLPDVI
jgi:hypothetical protein